jgi:hypothetical protein
MRLLLDANIILDCLVLEKSGLVAFSPEFPEGQKS